MGKIASLPLAEKVMFFPILRLVTDSAAAVAAIHKNHGELVLARFFGKRILFVAKPEHIEHIFSQEAKGAVSRDSLYEAKKPVFGDGLGNSKGDLWVNQRRLMQPFFNKDAVTAWNELMVTETQTMVNRLQAAGSREINVSLEMKALVQRIISKILFGDFVNEGNQTVLIDSVDRIMHGLVPQLASGLLGNNLFKHLFILQNRKFKKAVEQFTGFVYQAITDDKPQSDHKLIAMLRDARDNKSAYAMTEELLKDEAVTLFLAGQDTTINTLIWFFYEIGRHEAAQQKIAAEIAQHGDAALTPENLAQLTYTRAALYETLRHYPAATALTRQPVNDNFEIDNHRISRDTTLLISIYATHFDKQRWEQPECFYPEHFANPGLVGKRHRYAFMPYGGGIHNCIGKHLAEQEMMIIIVSLIRAFSFKTGMTVKKAISITYKPDRDVMVAIKPKQQTTSVTAD